MAEIDIIIPAHNEEENIQELGERLIKALNGAGIDYHLIFVDDHSTDGTIDEVVKLARKYAPKEIVYSNEVNQNGKNQAGNPDEIELLIDSPNIKLVKKIGPQGKATTILQGTMAGNSPYIAYIDADLQYPPEAIPSMYAKAKIKGMVVAERKLKETGFIRNIGTKLNKFIFEKMILGLNCDAQSGLKVFKREILDSLDTSQITPWTLDMPLILNAQDLGYSAEKETVEFSKRKAGKSKVNFFKVGMEITKSAFKLRFRKRKIITIKPTTETSLVGAGFAYKGKRFITHSRLSPDVTALHTFVPWQELLAALIASTLILGFVFNPQFTGILIVYILSVSYFIDLLFSAFIIRRSLNNTPEVKIDKKEIKKLENKNLPIYTILCPLYKESEVLGDFVDSIKKLDWPKDKLDVVLLLEEDDKRTIKKSESLGLPSYFRVLIVPDSQPKTKPKACNYGLAFAKGDYVVIYDAEDRPDPLQLKKAYLAFSKVSTKVVCLQCKLNYYNPNQNLLTRLFTAEYTLWFELILPGFQSLSTTLPLGGTSNHFRTKALRYLDGWDPFNVTEDCDLGTRLFKYNFQTAVIDSTTYEEANSRYKGWIKQRSRWIKGYLQTYLVHMRDPIGFYRNYGVHAFIFQAVTGMRMIFALVNPILWTMTIAYFTLRPYIGDLIESLYPPSIFYLATFTAVFGNFFYLYVYMIACAKKGYWWLIKYIFLIPFYWFSASLAAALAFYQLITKPHYWEKTKHGLNTGKTAVEEEEEFIPEPEIAVVPGVNIAYAKEVPETPSSKVKNNLFGNPAGNWRKIKGSKYAGSGVLVLATVFAHGLNFVFNAYLGRASDISDFGIISLINTISYLTSILTGALALTVSYKTAYILGKHNTPYKEFWKKVRTYAWSVSFAVTLIWIVSIPFLMEFFKTETSLPYVLFTPFWIISFVGAVDIGFLNGTLKFAQLALLTAILPVVKLAVAFFSVQTGNINGVYLSIPAASVIPFFLGWLVINRINRGSTKSIRELGTAFPKDFFSISILSTASTAIFLSADIILAKHYLPPIEAGEYALLSLSGKIIYFLGGLFSQFVNPMVSHDVGAQKESKSSFPILFTATLVTSITGFLAIGVFGKYTVPLLFGSKTLPILNLLPVYAIGVVCFTIATSVISYHQAKSHYSFAVLGFIVGLFEISYITLFHSSLTEIAEVVSLTGFFYLVNVTLLHFGYKNVQAFYRSFANFFSQPAPSLIPNPGPNNLKILIFNWRDINHIWSGGAEVYIHEIAKRWVAQGNEVTLFCGTDRKSPGNEVVDGVNIVRRGGFYLVYLWAVIYYLSRFRGKFDVVVDSENGIPFFTPLFVREPVVGLVHHVHKDIIMQGLKLPFYLVPVAFVAKWLESILMPLVYKNVQMATVSQSSKEDMKNIGFGKNKTIQIVNPGVDPDFLKPGDKTDKPTILYLGRLKAYKSIDVLIKALKIIINKNPEVTLKIAGFGEARRSLEKLAKSLRLEDNIEFLGKVNEATKAKLLRESWVFAYPSTMEGFGISAIEANASGTPVVASDVPGLRDSVKNPESGFLVPKGSHEAFAEKIEAIITDSNLRKKLEKESLIWSANFTWDKSAEKFLNILKFERTRRAPAGIPRIALSQE